VCHDDDENSNGKEKATIKQFLWETKKKKEKKTGTAMGPLISTKKATIQYSRRVQLACSHGAVSSIKCTSTSCVNIFNVLDLEILAVF